MWIDGHYVRDPPPERVLQSSPADGGIIKDIIEQAEQAVGMYGDDAVDEYILNVIWSIADALDRDRLRAHNSYITQKRG